ncbi:MAG: MarR family transcriptional regulator [Actinomycetota bacterium]|nr:MarR family transcriptional regulator [Actinomycetota bacterium]
MVEQHTGARSRRRPRTSYLVKRLETAMRSRLDALCARHGLSTMQYVALSVLAANGGMSSAELAIRSFVSPQSANQMVALLERRGLIERLADPANRRILRTRLTKAGAALLEACERDVDAFEREMFAGIGEAGEAQLRAALDACIANLSDRSAVARPAQR